MQLMTTKRIKERKIDRIYMMHEATYLQIYYIRDHKYRVHESYCRTDEFFETIEKVGLSDEKIFEILQLFLERQEYKYGYEIYCEPYVKAALANLNSRLLAKAIERHKRGGRWAFVMRKLRGAKTTDDG